MTAVSIRRANLARLAAGPAALAVALGALAVAQGPGWDGLVQNSNG